MSEIREALQAAMTQPEPAEEVAPVEAVEAAPEPAEAPAEVEAAPVETEKPKAERIRGPDGKFAKKQDTAEAPPVAKAAKQPAPKEAEAPAGGVPPSLAPGAAPAPPKFKPPQSWKPAAREEWAKVPESVQAEIDRRERETAIAMQESAPARKFHEEFQRTLAPYEPLLGGAQPIAVVKNLLQTAAALRTSPPAHKAQLVASMVKTFGVPIEELDAALAGEQPRQGQPAAIDPNAIAAKVRQEFEQDLRQRAHQREQQRIQTELQEFIASGKAEFFEDVKEQMAGLMDAGIAKTLEDAYNAAVKLNPEVSSVIQQREKAKQANAAMASTQRARAAASSVRTQPVAVSAPEDVTDRRAALRAAALKAAGG